MSMRRTEIVVGLLFLLSTGSFLVGSGMLDPILHQTNLLAGVESARTNLLVGVFLEFINAIAVVGIALLLQPTLQRYHESFAFGYFASRVMESVLLIVSLMGPLILLTLSKQAMSATASGDSIFLIIGHLVVDAHYLLFDMAMLVLSLGSLLFCYILHQSRLVPLWLSIIGFIGYAGLLASSSLSLAGVEAGELLFIPGAIFELALPIWLIFKGFKHQVSFK